MMTLYSTNCPQCRILEAKLDQMHFQYIIDEDVERMKAKGFTSAPMLEVDGVAMNFKESVEWLKNYAN